MVCPVIRNFHENIHIYIYSFYRYISDNVISSVNYWLLFVLCLNLETWDGYIYFPIMQYNSREVWKWIWLVRKNRSLSCSFTSINVLTKWTIIQHVNSYTYLLIKLKLLVFEFYFRTPPIVLINDFQTW